MKISVIVPAFNEEKLIAESLTCMKAASHSFTRRGWETELVVCDNNSTDATPALARAAGAKVVFEPVNQIARARNAGAAAATGDWFVFVDADSRPTAELFDAVANEIESGRCLAGGCVVRMDARYFWSDCLVGVWNTSSRIMKWAAGAFIFCEAAAFRKIGGFSNELFASEEIDLSKRLKALGRETGKRMVIIKHPPLVTSARKVRLLSGADLAKLFTSVILRPRQSVRSKKDCAPWYDGRR